MNFTITDDQILRLKDYNKNIKALASLAKQSTDYALFHLNGEKLTVYSIPEGGSSGFCQADFVVESTDTGYFCVNIDAVLTFISNLLGPAYLCTVSSDTITVKSAAIEKPSYTRTLMSTFSLEEKFAEIENRMSEVEKNDVTFNLPVTSEILKALGPIAATVPIVARNNSILVSGDWVSASDDTGRVRIRLPIPVEGELKLKIAAIPLCQEGGYLKMYDDWVVIDNDWEKFAFVQEGLQFDGYSDEELSPGAPLETDPVLLLKSEDLINAINSFKGIIDTSLNKVAALDVHVEVTDGAGILSLKYQDLLTEADADIPVIDIENPADFTADFGMATSHLSIIREAILSGDAVKFHVNGLDQESPDELDENGNPIGNHATIVYFEGDNFDIHIGKKNK